MPKTLHPSIEELWESYFPTQEELALHDYLRASISDILSALPKDSIIALDKEDEYKLDPKICSIVGDEWKEMVNIARVSYAVSRKWIDQSYKNAQELIGTSAKLAEFEHVTNGIFHDAVEAVARLWITAWKRFID